MTPSRSRKCSRFGRQIEHGRDGFIVKLAVMCQVGCTINACHFACCFMAAAPFLLLLSGDFKVAGGSVLQYSLGGTADAIP